MRTGAVFAALAAGALAVLAVASAGDAPAGFWAPEGFVARSDSFIATGALELRCTDQDSIVVNVAPGSPASAFFTASYLRSDVRTFNSRPDASRSPFLVEGCRLQGVDPFYHRVDLPYNRLPRWRGDVRLTAPGESATLEGGADQVLEVRHPVDRDEPGRASATVSPTDRGADVHATLVRIARPSSAEVWGDVFFVGERPVLADRRDVGSTDAIRVNGFRTPPGRMVALASGDWLQFAPGGGGEARSAHTYLVETGERARTASFVRVRNDRVERLYPARRLRPLLEPLSRAMDLALQSIPGADGGAVAEVDVRLTVERELSDGLDAVVADWCRRNAHPSRPRAVSMLVMDAFSGAVRALPSCPGEPELAAWEPLSSRTRERFLRNQNLTRHPAGSAVKPFWAAAVATTFPNLLDLEIPGHPAGPADRALGCPLRAPYHDTHGQEGWTGLETFIERSCNRYQVEMATAALALASSAGERCRGPLDARAFASCFPNALRARVAAGGRNAPSSADADLAEPARLRFCDAVVSTVLSPDLEVVGSTCRDLQLVDAKFTPARPLAALTNVAAYRDPAPGSGAAPGAPGLGDQYRLGRYRVDAWRGVLGELEEAGDTAHLVQTALRFSGVSPQAANLALNTVEELRTDWVNLLLGGENSRWSNFELAEAMARLVTGRGVRGTLTEPPRPRGAEGPGGPAFEPLPADALHPGARRRILHAMELVAGPGGTAARLGPAVARIRARLADVDPGRPWDLWVFAKTGTPAVDTYVSGTALERQGGVLLLGLLAAPADAGRDAAARVGDRVSACPLDPGLRRGILEVPPADLLDEDRAVALTAAVYLDDLEPGQGSGSAVTLAGRALEPLGDFLEREVRRKRASAGG